MPAEPKVKKAKTVEVNPHLSVDSPMVAWFVESLEGITSEELESIVDAPGGGGVGKAPDLSAHATFVAVCRGVFHPPEVTGALPNGSWVGNFREQAADAFGEAAGHDAEAHDGPHAIVLMSMGASLIGPIQQF
jgi:hypothetical protein